MTDTRTDQRVFEARAFNAVLPALRQAGEWLPLSARKAVAVAVVAELKPELDALAALREVARGYCAACGRGDAAPTVADWERERDERGRLEIANRALNTAAIEAVERAERAEAAVARGHETLAACERGEVVKFWNEDEVHTGAEIVKAVRAALQPPAPSTATEATDAWTPPPPGDRREQLPDGILAAIDIPPYTSTACQAADLCHDAIPIRLHLADELGQWADRLHARCRINNKFTGQLCACPCHQKRPAPAATRAATLDDILLDRCPHCPERIPRSQLDEHVDTVHVDLPPCTAAFDTGLDLVLCAFRVGHKDGEYGDWHATTRDAMGRTVWNDGAIGASPHHTQEQP